MHLRGFDRRGAAAALHSTSSSAFKVSGVFRDAADFCVLMLWEADDFFGHLDIKYLPDFDFTGVIIDFDLAYTNLQWIESFKFPSIDWPYLDYQLKNGSTGRVRLSDYITSRTGRAEATDVALTVNANTSSVQFDRVDIRFQRYVWEYVLPSGSKFLVTFSYFNSPGAGHIHALTLGANTYHYTQLLGDSSADVATGIALAAAADPNVIVTANTFHVELTPKISTGAVITVSEPSFNGPDTLIILSAPADYIADYLSDAINATSWDAGTPVTLSASSASNVITVSFQPSNYGSAEDANMAWIDVRSKTATLTITPDGYSQGTAATNPSSVHLTIPLNSVFGADVVNVRQMWLTFAPNLSDSIAYPGEEWEVDVTNWSLTDPSTKLPLKVSHPTKTVRVNSRDKWAEYSGSSWSEEAGFFLQGFARRMSTIGDKVVINYTCQYVHDLYVGTSLYSDRGIVSVVVDGDSPTSLDTYLGVDPPSITRRKLRSSISKGAHRVVITLTSKNGSSTGYNFYFDFLEASIGDDVQDPVATYNNRSAASDYGTDHGYKLSPQRLTWMMNKLGFRGDWNHYVSVFWWNQRRRRAGNIHAVEVTFSGWTALASTNTLVSLQFGGTTSGDPSGTYLTMTYLPANDTATTIAEYFKHFINSLLVGVWAESTGGVLTIHSRSPIYDFTFFTSSSGAVVGSISTSGDVRNGTEGVWEIDPVVTPVLNKGASSWHGDFWEEVQALGFTAVASFSQELANPPDDPPADVWAQRYHDGTRVLTSTGFGTEGQGFIEAFAGTTIMMTGHGYETGNSVTLTMSTDHTKTGVWLITVVDGDNFTIDELIGGIDYGVAAGDGVTKNLQTTHCAFSSVVSDYIGQAHTEMAGLMDAVGLTPWTQFGEVLHWFFSRRFARSCTAATNATPIAVTCPKHGLSTGNKVLMTGFIGNTAANGRFTITVSDANHFSLDSSVGNGTAQSRAVLGQASNVVGLVSGGSMAFYDDDQTAAATVALGRDLVLFDHQDSDPAVNTHADANFLRSRLKNYVDAVRAIVLGTYAGAKFELLWPYDVNYKLPYWRDAYPYPQGGRLNRYVNLPSEFETKVGSGLDRMKVEALSWGSAYRSLELAKESATFAYDVVSWSKSDTRYLIPWFNGGCPWTLEYLFTVNESTPHINFWAFDQFCLLSWAMPLPVNKATSGSF